MRGKYRRTEKDKQRAREMGLATKGKVISISTREKIAKGQRGQSHPWAGESGPFAKDPYERKLYLNNRRRALKASADGFHTQGEWETLKAQYNWKCPCCKKAEPQIKLTEDHIIPLIRGGSDNIENIQPLCKPCNSKKHIKIIKYHA